MSGELLTPDGAELLKEAANALPALDKALGGTGFIGRVIGRPLENLAGYLYVDHMAHIRIRRAAELLAETNNILRQRGLNPPFEAVSPSIGIPLLEAAIDETRDGLKELWARLLASAMDPLKKGLVRLSVIAAAKRLDPLDARVMNAISNNAGTSVNRNELPQRLSFDPDEIQVSVDNLISVGLLLVPMGVWVSPTPLGKILVKAVSEP